MKSFLKKIIASTFITFLLISSVAPVALAQISDIPDSLGAIKEKIDVVDYSQDTTWGGLSSELIEILKDNDHSSLKDYADEFAGNSTSQTINKISEIIKGKGKFKNSTDVERNAAANTILASIRITLWGNLPINIINILEDYHANLNEVKAAIDELKLNELNTEQRIEVFNQFMEGYVDLDTDRKLTTDEINLIIGEIQFKGESQINAIVLSVTKVIRNLLGGLAVIWIIISGIQLIMSGGDEAKVTEQKRSITYAVVGLGIVLLMERIVTLIYGIPGVASGLSTEGPGISSEIFGVITFMKALVGSIAILMIIVSGFRTIVAQGDEEKITNQKKSIMWVIVGIVVILINQVVVENLFVAPAAAGGQITQSNVQNIIELLGTVTQFILGFVGLIAFGVLIYGAGTMIANYGNDEMVDKAKKIIKNALIGIIVIISAFTIISTVIL